MIEGVIFDFNGTLFWDKHLHNQAWDQFLERHNIFLGDEEKEEKIHGKNNPDILRTLFGQEISSQDISQFSIEKELIYQDFCIKSELQLAEGARELIEFLKDHGIPYTIATASDKLNVDFFFERLHLGEIFEYNKVVYNDGSLKSKPHPDFFTKAMQILGIQASATLIFEDSISGIRAAERSGAGKIVIVNSAQESKPGTVHQQIRSFNEFDRSLISTGKPIYNVK